MAATVKVEGACDPRDVVLPLAMTPQRSSDDKRKRHALPSSSSEASSERKLKRPNLELQCKKTKVKSHTPSGACVVDLTVETERSAELTERIEDIAMQIWNLDSAANFFRPPCMTLSEAEDHIITGCNRLDSQIDSMWVDCVREALKELNLTPIRSRNGA